MLPNQRIEGTAMDFVKNRNPTAAREIETENRLRAEIIGRRLRSSSSARVSQNSMALTAYRVPAIAAPTAAAIYSLS
jgi:hypothetical protein